MTAIYFFYEYLIQLRSLTISDRVKVRYVITKYYRIRLSHKLIKFYFKIRAFKKFFPNSIEIQSHDLRH